jgi:hypothetical protein
MSKTAKGWTCMICGEHVPDGGSHTCECVGSAATSSTYYTHTYPPDPKAATWEEIAMAFQNIAVAFEHIAMSFAPSLERIAAALEAIFENEKLWDTIDDLLSACIAVSDHMENGGGEMDMKERLDAAIKKARAAK